MEIIIFFIVLGAIIYLFTGKQRAEMRAKEIIANADREAKEIIANTDREAKEILDRANEKEKQHPFGCCFFM